MSSHHFVREGQEPALLILDPLTFELAGPFLEWAPVVLVSDNALSEVLRWGIKIDVVLVTPGREEAVTNMVSEQVPVKIIRMEQGDSPARRAFTYLISIEQECVNVLSSTPESVFPLAETTMRQLHVNIVDGGTIWSGISTGRFEKWVTEKTTINIRQSTNLEPIIVQGLTKKGDRFESTEEGMISITSKAFFWVAESHS
jgi:hypothetical protein